MTALGETLEIAIDNAYNAIPKINLEGMFFRSDIGKKGLKND
jgi:Phosphoribosylamine-glycine ligase